MVWFGLVRFNFLGGFGMVWFGMVRYGLVWLGIGQIRLHPRISKA